MQEIKKGDKLLMQIIIRGVVRDQDISYAYERNGHLCVLWNDSVNTIAEMEGTKFTVLDKVKDKELIIMLPMCAIIILIINVGISDYLNRKLNKRKF